MTKDELMNVVGGGSSTLTVVGVVAVVITFLIGVIDGYMRPLSCNK